MVTCWLVAPILSDRGGVGGFISYNFPNLLFISSAHTLCLTLGDMLFALPIVAAVLASYFQFTFLRYDLYEAIRYVNKHYGIACVYFKPANRLASPETHLDISGEYRT